MRLGILLTGKYPYLQELQLFITAVVELAMHDTGTGAHHLNISRRNHLAILYAIPMA